MQYSLRASQRLSYMWSYYIMAKTNSTIEFKGFAQMTRTRENMTKAARAVGKTFKKFGKACDYIDANRNEVVEVRIGKEMYRGTVGEFMSMCGAVGKNGHITPASVKSVWHYKTDKGAMQIIRKASGMLWCEDPKDDKKVYTYNPKAKSDNQKYQPAWIYQASEVKDDAWTVDTICLGVAQGVTFEEWDKEIELTKTQMSEQTLYYFKSVVNKGGINNKAHEAKGTIYYGKRA